jgi:hypothetical protein
MANWLIGCGQITWPRDVSEEQVLADIAQAGYAGAPAFPKPATSVAERAALWQRYGLQALWRTSPSLSRTEPRTTATRRFFLRAIPATGLD